MDVIFVYRYTFWTIINVNLRGFWYDMSSLLSDSWADWHIIVFNVLYFRCTENNIIENNIIMKMFNSISLYVYFIYRDYFVINAHFYQTTALLKEYTVYLFFPTGRMLCWYVVMQSLLYPVSNSYFTHKKTSIAFRLKILIPYGGVIICP